MPTFQPAIAIAGATTINSVGSLDFVGAPATTLRVEFGTDGDDRVDVGSGAAFGGQGNDTFVLTSIGEKPAGPEHLGIIKDFEAGDTLDLSKLGEKAAILGREDDGAGGERVSIDFDGDGAEDGFVILQDGTEDGVDFVTILPFPLPGDGEFNILPFPTLGDAELHVLSGGDGMYSVVSSIENVTVTIGDTLGWFA